MAEEREYNFTDDSRLCIVQARFEALRLGSRVIQPAHLLLGVTKAISRPAFERLFPEAERFAVLCRSLGAEVRAAPVSAKDVTYSDEAIAVVAGADRAASLGRECLISPLHLLLGIHRPHDRDDRPVQRSEASAILDAAGVSAVMLETVLAAELN
jgi:hypothetical protein